MPPEVKVRLSVEGTPEAIAAFRYVQAQAQATGKASGRAFAPLSGALNGIKGLLAGAAAAFSLGALMSFGKQTLDTIEKLGRLADELGTSVEHMSGLSVAADLADADLDVLSGTMGKLTKSVDDLKNGSPTAAAAFARLGLAAKDFAGDDAAIWFETVAIRLNRLADGGSKSAAAMALMGRNGRAALSIMKQYIEMGGAKGAEARAEAMGVLVDSKTLANVCALGNSMKILKWEATGVALQFIKGMGPSAVAAMSTFTQAVRPGGTSAFQALASVIGWCLRAVVGLSVMGFAVLNSKLEATKATLMALQAASELITRGKFSQAGVVLNALTNAYAELDRTEHMAVADAWKLMMTKPEDLPELKNPTNRNRVLDEEKTAAESARLARKKQAIEDELKLTLDGLKAQEEAAKQSYERGKSSIADYYATRRRVAEESYAAEVAALQAQMKLADQEKDPEKRSTEQDRITAKARAAGAEIEAQLAKIASEQMTAIEGLSTEALKYEQSLLEAQGKTHEARMLGLAIEMKAYRDFLTQSGYDTATIDAMVAKRRTSLVAADKEGKQLTETGQAMGSALGSWLGSSINEVNSLGAAFRSLGLSIAAALQQLAAMAIAKTLVSFIPGMTAPVKKASGGLVTGPGTALSDNVFALLSNGEYVVRASAVRRPGMLTHLEAINRGNVQRHFRDYSREGFQRFAAGGFVQRAAGGGASQLGGSLTLNLPPGVQVRDAEAYLQTPDGSRLLVTLIAKNRRAIGQILR
jgi:hypothetical protein